MVSSKTNQLEPSAATFLSVRNRQSDGEAAMLVGAVTAKQLYNRWKYSMELV